MNEDLEQLEALAQTLYTGDTRRDAEINNIRTIIQGLAFACEEPELSETIKEVRERLRQLQDNPEYAGKHESTT